MGRFFFAVLELFSRGRERKEAVEVHAEAREERKREIREESPRGGFGLLEEREVGCDGEEWVEFVFCENRGGVKAETGGEHGRREVGREGCVEDAPVFRGLGSVVYCGCFGQVDEGGRDGALDEGCVFGADD